MRNLVDVFRLEEKLRLSADFGDITHFVVDEDGHYMFISGTSLRIACASASTGEVRFVWDVLEWAAENGTSLPCNTTMTSMTWAGELDAACLAFSTGELMILNVCSIYDSCDESQVSLYQVGTLDGGVASAAWSPDGEALVVLTARGQLVLMTPEWEVLWEGPVANNHPAFPQPTAPADAASHDVEAPCIEPHLNPSNCSISWRGDGKYFATCTHDILQDAQHSDPAKYGRPPRVRIWDREAAELHALGESGLGICPVISWQPNNRHLFVAHHAPLNMPSNEGNGFKNIEDDNEDSKARGPQGQAPEVRHVGAWKRELRRREEAAKVTGQGAACNKVILYERNGLQHGEFDLSTVGDEMMVENMYWSPDSDIIAIVLGPNPKASPEAFGSCDRSADATADVRAAHNMIEGVRTVQLWHRSNWHWYLKYEKRYRATRGLACSWLVPAAIRDLENRTGHIAVRSSLICLSAEGNFSLLKFVWDVNVSTKGTAVVIDGRNALVTPLRQCIVPPPMAAVMVGTVAPIISVAIRNATVPGDKEALALLQSSGDVVFVESNEEDFWEEALEKQLELHPHVGTRNPMLVSQATLPLASIREIKLGENLNVLELPPAFRHVAWLNQTSVLVIACVQGGDILLEVDVTIMVSQDRLNGEPISSNAINDPFPLINHTVRPLKRVVRCSSLPEEHGVVLELEDGQLWTYCMGGRLESLNQSFPEICFAISVLPKAKKKDFASEHRHINDCNHVKRDSHVSPLACRWPVLGLSSLGKLYINACEIAEAVTSFSVRFEGPGGPFILYTSKYHTLHTVPLLPVLNPGNPLSSLLPGGALHDARQLRRFCQISSSSVGLSKLNAASGAPPIDDIFVRNIEEGAWLVSVPAGSEDVICQAPRGNLEVVRPRALVLYAVSNALDKDDISTAWFLSTVNRLDLNIMIDYRWPRALQYADRILEAIGSDIDAADFLCTLKPDNVCRGNSMYAGVFEEDRELHSQSNAADSDWNPLLTADVRKGDEDLQFGELDIKNKIGSFCSAIRKAAEESDEKEQQSASLSGRWLRTRAMSYSAMGDLASALKLIKAIREAELRKGDMPSNRASEGISYEEGSSDSCTAEQAMKYLLINIGEEAIYCAALGCYELEVAYMAVTHSQRDPGEALLELQRFAAIEDTALKRARIDHFLGNHESAVSNYLQSVLSENHFDTKGGQMKVEVSPSISNSHRTPLHPNFVEALKLSRKHGLLRFLLSLLATPRVSHDDRCSVSEGSASQCSATLSHTDQCVIQMRLAIYAAIGEELESKNRYEDAALAYIAGRDGEKALRAYRLAGEWKPAMTLAIQLGRDSSTLKAMASRMALDLEESHRHVEAADLVLEHLGDIPEAVRLLCAGGEWRRVVHLVHARGHQGLLESTITPAAVSAAHRILQNTREDRERVSKYRTRLEEVRARREAMAAAVASRSATCEADVGVPDADDLASEAPSVVSGLSAYTLASGMTGATGSSNYSASASVLTKGGKGRQGGKKKGKKGSKIRQGSPEEAMELARLLIALSPLPAVCIEVGQLAELLCMLGNADDATTLQRAMKLLIDEQQDAVKDVLRYPPLGLGLQVDDGVKEKTMAVGGPPAVEALENALQGVPGEDISRRVAENESSLRTLSWKWEVLRDP